MAQKVLHLKQTEFFEIENIAREKNKSGEKLLLEVVRDWLKTQKR